MSKVTIAVDAMGGDYGLDTTLPAVINALNSDSDLEILFFGDKSRIEQLLSQSKINNKVLERIIIRHADETVGMDEEVSQALRTKRHNSSMALAIKSIADGTADACVSAGNTGALLALSKYILKLLPNVTRPAIMRSWEFQSGKFNYMLDLGANIDCSARQLFEFAIIGSGLVQVIEKINKPKVALLNIGIEANKGTTIIKEADRLISDSNLVNYIGYIEPNNLFFTDADVVVCDGFIGNIAIKTVEGFAKYIKDQIVRSYKKNILNKIFAVMALPLLSRIKSKIDMRKYNGASLVGLNGIVVKSHGGSDSFSFAQAIKVASHEARLNLTQKLVKIMSDVSFDGV